MGQKASVHSNPHLEARLTPKELDSSMSAMPVPTTLQGTLQPLCNTPTRSNICHIWPLTACAEGEWEDTTEMDNVWLGLEPQMETRAMWALVHLEALDRIQNKPFCFHQCVYFETVSNCSKAGSL